MRTNLFFFTLFIAICATSVCRAQSDDPALTGVWTISKVEIRKTIDGGAPEVRTLEPGDDNDFGLVQLPVKITFDATSVTFEYAARQRVGRYTLSGGKLHIEFISHAVDYGCVLSGNGIKLTQTVDYVINDDETVHQATDEYAFYGQK